MNFPLFVAKKYFLSKNNPNVINIISIVSMVGVAVGTMSLIVMLSVFNGFEDLVKSLYNSFYPDIEIKIEKGKTFSVDSARLTELKRLPEVEAVSEVIEEGALLRFGDKMDIATLKGVDEHYREVTGINEKIIAGEYLLQGKLRNYAILGSGIEYKLGLNPNVDMDSAITVFFPKRGEVTNVGYGKSFVEGNIYPGGTFSIQQDFDVKYVIVPISFMRHMLRYNDEVSALEVKIAAGANVGRVQEKIQQIYGDAYMVRDRYQQNEFLYKVISSERWAVYAIFSLVLLISAFNIVGSLIMLVIEKSKDIFILKSMGATDKQIRNIYLSEGLLITMIGGAIGTVLAIILCLLQEYFGIVPVPGGTFVVQSYPVEMRITDFVMVLMISILIAIIASWYPAHSAARRETTLRPF